MLTLDGIEREIQNIMDHGTNREDVACLADLFVCRSAMRGGDAAMSDEKIEATGSEFSACVNGKCFSEILPFLEELLDAVKVLHPRMYESFISKLKS